MALTLPTPAELIAHRDAVGDGEALQRAADLFQIATGVTDTPTDLFESRLVKQAILDMAWFLQTRHDDQEEAFSPFSSERIGSYSYAKVAAAAKAGEGTGVPAFDAAVSYFNTPAIEDMFAVSSEWVFTEGYHDGRPPREEPVWDRPLVTVLDGGSLELDEFGNPVLEIEGDS